MKLLHKIEDMLISDIARGEGQKFLTNLQNLISEGQLSGEAIKTLDIMGDEQLTQKVKSVIERIKDKKNPEHELMDLTQYVKSFSEGMDEYIQANLETASEPIATVETTPETVPTAMSEHATKEEDKPKEDPEATGHEGEAEPKEHAEKAIDNQKVIEAAEKSVAETKVASEEPKSEPVTNPETVTHAVPLAAAALQLGKQYLKTKVAEKAGESVKNKISQMGNRSEFAEFAKQLEDLTELVYSVCEHVGMARPDGKPRQTSDQMLKNIKKGTRYLSESFFETDFNEIMNDLFSEDPIKKDIAYFTLDTLFSEAGYSLNPREIETASQPETTPTPQADVTLKEGEQVTHSESEVTKPDLTGLAAMPKEEAMVTHSDVEEEDANFHETAIRERLSKPASPTKSTLAYLGIGKN